MGVLSATLVEEGRWNGSLKVVQNVERCMGVRYQIYKPLWHRKDVHATCGGVIKKFNF